VTLYPEIVERKGKGLNYLGRGFGLLTKKSVKQGKIVLRDNRRILRKIEAAYGVGREILVDCDEDTVVFKVEQLGGAACHEGYRSCFFRQVSGQGLAVTGEKIFDPAKVYK